MKQRGLIKGPPAPLYFADGVTPEFATPSGKIEFYSPQLEAAGFDPVPRYQRPEAGPPGSFRLLFGRAPCIRSAARSRTRYCATRWTRTNSGVNANVGARLGLTSGDYVRLRNQDGVLSNRIKARVTEAIRSECVYMVHGFGHTSRGLAQRIRPRCERRAVDHALRDRSR